MDRDLARALAMFDNEFGRLSFGPTRRESPLLPARRGSTDARRNPIPWGAPPRREGRPWDTPPARRTPGFRGRLAQEGILPADATPKRSSGRKRPDSKGEAKEARAAPPEKRSPRAPAEAKPTDPFSRLVEDEMLLSEETTRWEDVGGLDATKQLLTEAAVLPMLIPGFFTGVRTPWRGVLLFGPPGTGKTLLARAVAAQARAAFFSVSPSSLLSKFVGESEKVAKAVYDCARARAPAVVFFDEVDALASRRGASTEHEASRRLKTELLTQIDGINTGASVLTLATSNRPWDLDEAMRRRLERRIYVPPPDNKGREAMLRIHTTGLKLAADVDLAELADKLEGYSGADVQLVCRDAAMAHMRAAIAGKSPDEIVELQTKGQLEGEITSSDFLGAVETTPPSIAPGSLRRFEAWNAEFGCELRPPPAAWEAEAPPNDLD